MPWSPSTPPKSSGMPALIQQYRQAGIEGTFVGAVGTILPTVFKIAGEPTTGIVSADIYFPDLPPFDKIKENLDFVEAYKQGAQGGAGQGRGASAPRRSKCGRVAANGVKSLDRKTVAEAIRGKTVERHDPGRRHLRGQRPGQAQAHHLQGHRRQDRARSRS